MEDLKQMWQQYDEKLQRTQAFNEQVLRRMATRNSADRIDKMRNLEVFGLSFIGIMLVLIISRVNTLGVRREITVSYWLVVAQLLGWMAWSIRKVAFLHKMDMSKLAVTEMLSRMSRFRLMLVRERLWGGLSVLLFFLMPFTIVMDYWMTGHTDILTNWKPYVLRLIPALAIGIATGLWLYRRYYMQPIDSITHDLQEIESFSQSGVS